MTKSARQHRVVSPSRQGFFRNVKFFRMKRESSCRPSVIHHPVQTDQRPQRALSSFGIVSVSRRTRRRTPRRRSRTLVESRRSSARAAGRRAFPATDHASPLARAIALDDDEHDDEHARDADVDPRAGRASSRARARDVPADVDARMPTRTPSPRSRASPPWKPLERHRKSSGARSSPLSLARGRSRDGF